MTTIRAILPLFVLLLASCGDVISPATGSDAAAPGPLYRFDEFGYNDQARIFVGSADGVDRMLDGLLWGSPAYANDHLVMKWNEEWDRGNDEDWLNGPYEAWINNEWNGQMPGGSGEIWHYKIIWVGTSLEASSYWVEGGYPVWGQFEVVFSQGTFANEHFWDAHANPSGFGASYGGN